MVLMYFLNLFNIKAANSENKEAVLASTDSDQPAIMDDFFESDADKNQNAVSSLVDRSGMTKRGGRGGIRPQGPKNPPKPQTLGQ